MKDASHQSGQPPISSSAGVPFERHTVCAGRPLTISGCRENPALPPTPEAAYPSALDASQLDPV